MYLKSYLKSCKRGKFEWKPMTIEDNDVTVEELKYNDMIAIIAQTEDSFFIRVEGLQHSPFYITNFRKSRNTARKYAEKLILKDIEKSKTLAICDMELLTK